MRGTMIILPPVGALDLRVLDRPLALGELHTAVGGYIEVVPNFETFEYLGHIMCCVAFCDEDGIRKQLPLNNAAMSLWHRAIERKSRSKIPSVQALLGPVVVIFGDREFMSEL